MGIEPSVQAEDGKHLLVMSSGYSDAVYQAGGIPMLLAAPLGGEASADDLLERIDALLFTGGPDFHTERLGLGPVHPTAESASHRFAVGVQWHPEREERKTPHHGLFRALIVAASGDRATHAANQGP